VSREAVAKRRQDNETEFSRIVAFSDGVFSIAITLLVLNLHIPKNLESGEVGKALWDQREFLFAYGISFAVIARFWINHHRFFGQVTAFDGRLIGLNMLYLAFIVLMPFSTEVLGEYASAAAAVLLYAGNLIAVVLLSQVMISDARRAGLTSIDDDTHREGKPRVAWIVFVFALSIPVALVDAHLAPFCWLLLFFDPSQRLAARRG
jgi:uncharacterized membrane protein